MINETSYSLREIKKSFTEYWRKVSYEAFEKETEDHKIADDVKRMHWDAFCDLNWRTFRTILEKEN